MKKTGLFALLSAFCILLVSCAGQKTPESGLQRYSKTVITVFDTVTVISAFDESEEAFLEKAAAIEAELEQYHKLYDIYHSYEGINNLKTVNDNAGVKPVEVDGRIIDLLEAGIEIYSLTSGMTNIAMGSVLKLWHDARETASGDPGAAYLPEKADLEAAAEHTDINSIVIDRGAGTVFISDPEASLDVGALAKGYATDRVCETIRKNGWTGVALSVGGNVKTVGTKADGGSWKVGIQNPDLTSEQSYVRLLRLSDLSLVTSGSYQRYFTFEGKNYHHIINPYTLYPENRFVSVSVICESSGRGDALSTALFNMSYEDGLALAEGLENTEVLWIFPDGTMKNTPGLDALIEK